MNGVAVVAAVRGRQNGGVGAEGADGDWRGGRAGLRVHIETEIGTVSDQNRVAGRDERERGANLAKRQRRRAGIAVRTVGRDVEILRGEDRNDSQGGHCNTKQPATGTNPSRILWGVHSSRD